MGRSLIFEQTKLPERPCVGIVNARRSRYGDQYACQACSRGRPDRIFGGSLKRALNCKRTQDEVGVRGRARRVEPIHSNLPSLTINSMRAAAVPLLRSDAAVWRDTLLCNGCVSTKVDKMARASAIRTLAALVRSVIMVRAVTAANGLVLYFREGGFSRAVSTAASSLHRQRAAFPY
jgi:hypothetical protein